MTKEAIINRACEWLEQHLYCLDCGLRGDIRSTGYYDSMDEFLEDFRRDMEKEEQK